MSNTDDFITCPAHLHYVTEPVILQCCQRAYCKRCLIALLKANNRNCLVCNKEIKSTVEEIQQTPISELHYHLVVKTLNKDVNRSSINDDDRKEIKISFLGFSSAGKSSLIRCIKGFPFVPNLPLTVGVDICHVNMQINDEPIKLQIWDTAGQDRFRTIIRTHYRQTSGIVLVYDVTNFESFEALDPWMSEISENCAHNNNLVILLIGNKIDETEKRCVTQRQAECFADHYNLLYCEASAKTGENVREAVERLVRKIINLNSFEEIVDTGSIALIENQTYKPKKKCCK